jgi:hypothetical protein
MRPGTKVICVDDSIRPEMIEWQKEKCPNWVKKDEHYTIRHFDSHDDIVDGVLLEEIKNNLVVCIPFGKVLEPRFATWRFRELETPDPVAELIENVEEITL